MLAAALLPGTASAGPASEYPGRRRSIVADTSYDSCRVPVKVAGVPMAAVDAGPAYPQWVPVVGEAPAILEGIVRAKINRPDQGPAVAVGDLPTAHHTHDFCYHVEPDPTPDNRFTDLLGVQVHAGGLETFQKYIGIEWESGVGADNDGNPASAPNRRGDSYGYFSYGHRRGEVFWNWLTEGDRVHLEGRWIWDRGHPPSKIEIHPARFVAATRHLPEIWSPDGRSEGLATRTDVYGSGDGGAVRNNLPGLPAWVPRVPMSEKNYTFEIAHAIPRPSPDAVLRWAVETRPGDTFPAAPEIRETGPGAVRVTVPWGTRQAPDTAVFGRTIRLYWDGGDAKTATGVRRFKVTLEDIRFKKTHDLGSGEYRIFAEVGGQWIFLNEFLPAEDILKVATDVGHVWNIGRSFDVAVNPGDSFRVHAGGWEADGINQYFGHLVDPDAVCDEPFKTLLGDNVWPMLWAGSRDDSAGNIREIHGTDGDFRAGAHAVTSTGAPEEEIDVWTGEDTDPHDTFVMRYRVEELP